MEESELVQQTLRGDEKAAREFVLTYRDYMYKTCCNILGYRDPDAEDMVQEAFVIAFRKLPGFQFRAPLRHWMAQICVYLCYRHIRKRTRMIVKLDVELEALTDRAVLESLPGREAEKERKEKLEFLDACLIKIGKDCRRIVEMRDKEEKSYVEIGKDLKIPIGTVMSRLSRCKEALKTLALQILKEEKNG